MGKLTDDDLTEIEGMEEKLLGLLQKNTDMLETEPSRSTRKSWNAMASVPVQPGNKGKDINQYGTLCGKRVGCKKIDRSTHFPKKDLY
jgi:hypothetical protein